MSVCVCLLNYILMILFMINLCHGNVSILYDNNNFYDYYKSQMRCFLKKSILFNVFNQKLFDINTILDQNNIIHSNISCWISSNLNRKFKFLDDNSKHNKCYYIHLDRNHKEKTQISQQSCLNQLPCVVCSLDTNIEDGTQETKRVMLAADTAECTKFRTTGTCISSPLSLRSSCEWFPNREVCCELIIFCIFIMYICVTIVWFMYF